MNCNQLYSVIIFFLSEIKFSRVELETFQEEIMKRSFFLSEIIFSHVELETFQEEIMKRSFFFYLEQR